MNRLYIPTITPIFASVARIIIAIYVALVFVSVLIERTRCAGVVARPVRRAY